jgi:hypothetical protein
MRFPSFIKIQQYKRFEITPRYYDPIKEEIAQRTAQIKREMNGEAPTYVSGRISFERKSSSIPSASFMQLIIAAGLGLSVLGWLYLGNEYFYVLWLAVPIYLYFRFKKSSSRKK